MLVAASAECAQGSGIGTIINVKTHSHTWGAWCSGITSASHAEGPGFKSQCVHCFQLECERGRPQSVCFRERGCDPAPVSQAEKISTVGEPNSVRWWAHTQPTTRPREVFNASRHPPVVMCLLFDLNQGHLAMAPSRETALLASSEVQVPRGLLELWATLALGDLSRRCAHEGIESSLSVGCSFPAACGGQPRFKLRAGLTWIS